VSFPLQLLDLQKKIKNPKTKMKKDQEIDFLIRRPTRKK